MPFIPELFSGRALAQFYDKRRRDELEAVPYFDGLMAGEPDALVQSFATEPELHDPVRGRVKGHARVRGIRYRDERLDSSAQHRGRECRARRWLAPPSATAFAARGSFSSATLDECFATNGLATARKTARS
jgi:hypothetical protein